LAEAQSRGFQAQELAGRLSRWEKREGQLRYDRILMERAIRMRDDLWKLAFTKCGLEPPKPRTDLVTKQGDTVYVVKWTSELTRPQSAPPAQPRPAPTPEAGATQPSDDVEGGPQLIYTRKPLPTLRPQGRPPPCTTPGWQSMAAQLEETARRGAPPRTEAAVVAAQAPAAGPTPQADRIAGPGRRDNARSRGRARDRPRRGGANGKRPNAHPASGTRAGYGQPSAKRVAGPSHQATHHHAAELGNCLQRSGAAAGSAARCLGPSGGATPTDHYEAHSVDPARLTRRRELPTGAVRRGARGVRNWGGGPNAVAFLGRTRCQSDAGAEAEQASRPHWDPAE
jgi:hypothetical protein